MRSLSVVKRYMIYAKPETRTKFETEMDKYGDSYTLDTTVPILREVCFRFSSFFFPFLCNYCPDRSFWYLYSRYLIK
jgi:hypothetical protein